MGVTPPTGTLGGWNHVEGKVKPRGRVAPSNVVGPIPPEGTLLVVVVVVVDVEVAVVVCDVVDLEVLV